MDKYVIYKALYVSPQKNSREELPPIYCEPLIFVGTLQECFRELCCFYGDKTLAEVWRMDLRISKLDGVGNHGQT